MSESGVEVTSTSAKKPEGRGRLKSNVVASPCRAVNVIEPGPKVIGAFPERGRTTTAFASSGAVQMSGPFESGDDEAAGLAFAAAVAVALGPATGDAAAGASPGVERSWATTMAPAATRVTTSPPGRSARRGR